MCNRKVFSAGVIVLCLSLISSAAIIGVGDVEMDGTMLLSATTTDGYTVTIDNLILGTTTSPGGENIQYPGAMADNFDFSDAASNDYPLTTLDFDGVNFSSTNGALPDFFMFEAVGSRNDMDVRAIFLDDSVGQPLLIPQSLWVETGTNGAFGQPVGGLAFSITDLLDTNGNNLTEKTVIRGLQIAQTATGVDPVVIAAVKRTNRSGVNPSPPTDANDVPRNIILSWEPAIDTFKRDVYLGTDFGDVNDATLADPLGVLVSTAQETTSYQPENPLEYGQTYYWRIDEANESEVYKGLVWNFTVEPFAYPIQTIIVTASSAFMGMPAEATIDGSGMDGDVHGTDAQTMWLTSPTDTSPWIQYEFDRPYKIHEMWVWNQNQVIEAFVSFGTKDVTIEISVDGTNWMTLENVQPFTKGEGADNYTHNTTVDFAGQVAKFVKINIVSGWGATPQKGLSEVRFLTIPTYAREPQPADGATAEKVDLTLGWRAGSEAALHEVVLSDNLAAVEDGTAVIGTPSENSLNPAGIEYSQTYYWQVNEINDAAVPTLYPGDIWSFTAPEYLVIDDFEIYADKEFLEIWAFWADGYQNDDNGAIVGNGNAGERDIVYEGRQSMPIHYDNSGAAISEVTREFSPALDLTMGNPSSLSLQVRGDAPALLENADGSMTVGAAGEDIWGVADDFRFVYKSLSGNGSITAKVEDLAVVHNWAKAGVMIRESLASESSFAYICTTGANGTRYQHRLQGFIEASSDDSALDGIQENLPPAPVWVKIERVGDNFNGYYKTDDAGANWVAMGANPVAITMLPNVYIGLAVTSHDTANSTVATFSNVATTGGVSGAWTPEAIGGEHPANVPAPMYVTLADTDGRMKTFPHPNPNQTADANWTPWHIPLSELGSVDPGSIASVAIGVGQPGGNPGGETGTVFVDLLRVGTPAQ